jgi:hypothetical protein
MKHIILVAVAAIFFAGVVPCGPGKAPAQGPINALIETTLSTASGQIRQFAFDGDLNTYFASVQNPNSADHFTLVFDKPVAVKTIVATTGRSDGRDKLDEGTLDISADGKTFRTLVQFADGVAHTEGPGARISAIRIQPTAEMRHPLAIREISIVSEPALTVFKYPVEISVDVTDAPNLKEWAEKAARVCQMAYPMINEELKSPGFKPRHFIRLALKRDYKGVAFTTGGNITAAVDYFRSHPEDVGALVHETVHTVQAYRGRNNPGWLVEGIADYIRFFKYEPGNLGRIDAKSAHYDRSYRVTAAFLAYLTDKYDRELVRKLNRTLREGKYQPAIFQELTGKSALDLDVEWRATLRR